MPRLATAILAAWIVQASSADAVKTSLRSPLAESDNASRRLSFERIANYAPRSQVTDHNAIDLDQKFLEKALSEETSSGFAQAERIYKLGGNSKTIAQVGLLSGLTNNIPEGTDMVGEAEDNDEINLTLYKDAERDTNQLSLRYATSEVQAYFNQCRVGGMESEQKIMNGCLKASGEIKLKNSDQTIQYSYSPATANYNARTLQYFSEQLEAKMLDCPRCPYKDAKMFSDYYGSAKYADEWILAALDGGKTNFVRGDANFLLYGYAGRRECVKKATAYMSVFMFALRSFEKALDFCVDGDDIGAIHSWDKGVAYYTGSTEDQSGLLNGYLMHQLADKRCKNFRTCGPSGGLMQASTSRVNHDILALFNQGQDQVDNLSCAAAQVTKEAIADLMYIPLVQGAIRYAYKVDKESGGEKEKAEGAVFAAAVLPRVYQADTEAAEAIYNNMRVGAPSTDVNVVKEAFESVYRKMGIGCEEVGGIVNSMGEYLEGMRPCTASDDGTRGNDNDDRNKGTDNDEGTANDNDQGSDNDQGTDNDQGSDNDQGTDNDQGSDNDQGMGGDNDMNKGGDDDDKSGGGKNNKAIILGSVLGSLSGVLLLGTIGTLMFIRGRNKEEDAVFDANKATPSIS